MPERSYSIRSGKAYSWTILRNKQLASLLHIVDPNHCRTYGPLLVQGAAASMLVNVHDRLHTIGCHSGVVFPTSSTPCSAQVSTVMLPMSIKPSFSSLHSNVSTTASSMSILLRICCLCRMLERQAPISQARARTHFAHVACSAPHT